MELWVRSQDKKKLVKVDELKMETVKDGNTFIYSHATDLGTYETKERALEVLDEIQKMMTLRLTLEGTYQENDLAIKSNILCFMVKIYEMPKE